MELNNNLYQELVDSFGVSQNDILLISSDITNLAKHFKSSGEAFNVNTFIDTLQESMPSGTIIIPAYTDNLRNGDVFDYKKSKPTTGALSNRIGRRKDFTRTFDPIHSVYVWGSHKEEIVGLSDETAFGEKSIFGFLAKENTKFVFIDVDLQNSFTFVHYLEQKENVSYRKFYPLEIQIKNEDIVAPKLIQFHTKKIGVSTNLYPLQKFLLDNKFLLEKEVCGARIQLSSADAMTNGVKACQNKGIKLYKFEIGLAAKQIVKRILGKNYF
jgi:aminoglycoside 3-N-acetyltransferase